MGTYRIFLATLTVLLVIAGNAFKPITKVARMGAKLSMTNNSLTRKVASIAISIGIFGTPLATYAASKDVTLPSDTKASAVGVREDASLKNLANSKGKNILSASTKFQTPSVASSKPSAPKFRTSEELALYNFKLKEIQLKARIDNDGKREQASKLAEGKVKSVLGKAEREQLLLDKKLSVGVSKSITPEAKAELLKQQLSIKQEVGNEKAQLKSIQATISSAENDMKSSKNELVELSKNIKTKEAESKKKVAELAESDKQEAAKKAKAVKEANIREIRKKEVKAKAIFSKAESSVKKVEGEAATSIAARVSAEKNLVDAEKLKEREEAKILALKKEIEVSNESLTSIAKLITTEREQVVKTKNDVKKIETVVITAKNELAASSKALKDVQNILEKAMKN